MGRVRSSDRVQFRTNVVRDQHGRRWEVLLDPDSFVPCAPPLPRFRAPLDVPLQFLRFSADDLGFCTIDYVTWAEQWGRADGEYQRTLTVGAQEMFNLPLTEVPTAKMPALLAAVGEPPQSVEFVHAAAAGNRWVLGIPKADGSAYDVPEWAQPILDRMAPRWQQAVPGTRPARAAIDLSRYADEDGAAPALMRRATDLAVLASEPDLAVAGALPFGEDEEDFDALTGGAPRGSPSDPDPDALTGGAPRGSPSDPDPDGLAEVTPAAVARARARR